MTEKEALFEIAMLTDKIYQHTRILTNAEVVDEVWNMVEEIQFYRDKEEGKHRDMQLREVKQYE